MKGEQFWALAAQTCGTRSSVLHEAREHSFVGQLLAADQKLGGMVSDAILLGMATELLERQRNLLLCMFLCLASEFLPRW